MESKIYLLQDNIKTIGKGVRYPPHQKMSTAYDYTASNSIHKLRHTHFPDFEPNLSYALLSKGVTLNDKIGSSPFPFYVLFVSKNLVDFIKDFNLPKHKLYKVEVIQEGNAVDGYYALHILDDEETYNYIDFERSEISVCDINKRSEGVIKKLNLRSYQDFLATELEIIERNSAINYKQEPSWIIWASSLHLKRELCEAYDLFSYSRLSYPLNIKVNQKFKEAAEKSKLTGITFSPISKSRDEIEIKSVWGANNWTSFSF